ncbi:U-box domain-containing protein 43-like [Dorcoceras hygrometricum]|uniref:U-box domain-containing protein 43-like n=1 Tax=Dorcoceras hygrometricum TaxID=472368 RepID=A0A2Z7CRB7_9LAMI|nr:U-box domain-containing protein 43-like [Dorcoceras hygrometricum]
MEKTVVLVPVLEQDSLTIPEFDSSTINSISSSSLQTEPLTEFSVLIEKLSPVLDEMKQSVGENELPALEKAIESLETDYKQAKSAMDYWNNRSSPLKRLEDLTQNLGRSLGLVLFASHEVPLSNKDKIEALCKEMMNARFESDSEQESDSAMEVREMDEADETEGMDDDDDEDDDDYNDEDDDDDDEEDDDDNYDNDDDIVEEDTSLGTLSIDDVFVYIRSDNEEKFKKAIIGLNSLIMDSMVSDEKLNDEDVVNVLCNRLTSCVGCERVSIIQILRYLVTLNDQNKEKMVELGFLTALVLSLTRDAEEQREAVGLLSGLCADPGVRKRIGRIQGCVVMLVAISNGDDGRASHDARMLLDLMSGNTQHALHMAEAGYFRPLIKFLTEVLKRVKSVNKEVTLAGIITLTVDELLQLSLFYLEHASGSDMCKVLMATALSRMELTEQNKISLGEDGAIEPLVKMFSTGNLEAKLSSLNALQNLSDSKQNIQLLIDSGVVVPLLQLLFSVTSVIMTLREPASAILAKVAQSETIVLIKQDISRQMLSLLNLSSPIIQNHLLEALNSITSHENASKVRKKMKDNGAIQILLPFFSETDSKIRAGALKLVYTLSKDSPGELVENLGYPSLNILSKIASLSTSESEKAAAFGILSNFPVNDRRVTDILKSTNLFHSIASFVSLSHLNSTPAMVWLAESIAGILIRFTVPTDKGVQHYSVEKGVIPILLKLLMCSSEVAKCKAALCLSQLSQNSLNLSKSQKMKWFCLPNPSDSFCDVHGGYCSIKSTFCLIKAGAITPLIQILNGVERASDEAILSCLATLLEDEIWQAGSNYIVKISGVGGVFKVLESGTIKSREKALWILERILRVEAYRAEYGEYAKMVLIDLAQNGDAILKPKVAKVLAQLELLQDQSSYF